MYYSFKQVDILTVVEELNKKQLVDAGGAYTERTTLIKANYQLNRFLTKDDINELENIKKIDENQYRIYVLGEWGIEDKTKKFAYAFSPEKHVKATKDRISQNWEKIKPMSY